MADREKSALYPGATWSECLELIKRIDSFGLKTVSYQELAKKYGLSSVTTKSFTAKIGAAKQFGLIITSQGSAVQLTVSYWCIHARLGTLVLCTTTAVF